VFHQFEKGTADRIRYQRVNECTTDEVEYSDIVKGAETGGGHYVMLDQEELDSVAPGRSRSMEIHTFVDLGRPGRSTPCCVRRWATRIRPRSPVS